MSGPVRPCTVADLDAVYGLCADVDATGAAEVPELRRRELAGQVYAGPYFAADPQLSFVIDDEEGVAGYLSATADTVAFAAWQEREWWPALRERYRRTMEGPRDRALLAAVHAGPGAHRFWFDTHPAHLHIKVAPRLQGRGGGRSLVNAALAALRTRGVPGVHVGVAEANGPALAFYAALGFTVVHRHTWGRTLGLDL